jgi:RNA polymerase sigma factor (sigma-70 family)
VKELAIYEPVDLTEDEKKVLEQQLADGFKVLNQASIDVYGFANVKKLRNEYKNGTVKLSGKVKQTIDQLIAVEKRVIAGYIRMASKLCGKSRKRYGITVCDYLQEAAMAIYDAMYLYNGQNRFSTYAFWCIKNRIVDFYRSENDDMAFNDAVSAINIAAVRSVKTTIPKGRRGVCGLTDANVFNTLTGKKSSRIDFESFSPAVIERMANCLYQTDYETESVGMSERVQLLLDAVASASLTEMERCLIDAEIRGDSGFRTRISETVINSNTGKLWTKQRLSQLYIRACEKIRVAMERRVCEAA